MDKYAELISGVNEAIEGLENGSVVVASASNASTTDYVESTTVGKYASADISKGTIEERLSAAGF